VTKEKMLACLDRDRAMSEVRSEDILYIYIEYDTTIPEDATSLPDALQYLPEHT